MKFIFSLPLFFSRLGTHCRAVFFFRYQIHRSMAEFIRNGKLVIAIENGHASVRAMENMNRYWFTIHQSMCAICIRICVVNQVRTVVKKPNKDCARAKATVCLLIETKSYWNENISLEYPTNNLMNLIQQNVFHKQTWGIFSDESFWFHSTLIKMPRI